MVREAATRPRGRGALGGLPRRGERPLRAAAQWLLTRGSGEEAFGPNPDLDLPEPGRQILAVLSKRKVDLTPEDIEVMREAIDRIRALMDAKPDARQRRRRVAALPARPGPRHPRRTLTPDRPPADGAVPAPGTAPARPVRTVALVGFQAGRWCSPAASAAACRSPRVCSSRVSRFAYSVMSAGSGTSGRRRRNASTSRAAAVCAAAARRSSSRSSAVG